MLKFMEKYEASLDTVITLSVDKLEQYISRRNQEISILVIMKKQNKVNRSSLKHRNFQRRIDKTENKGPQTNTKQG
jgi:ribosomal protein L39E